MNYCKTRPLLLFCAVALIAFCGCATPPAIKQAVTSLDDGYGENLKLMRQYRQLVEKNTLRYQQWTVYVENRAYLNLALLWTTTNPSGGNDVVEEVGKRLGPKIIGLVNQNRLNGLPVRSDPNAVVFQAGTNDMTHLVQALPALVNAVRDKVAADYGPRFRMDLRAFDDYEKNVSALRQINAVIKRYLDIDVTVRSEDVKDIAESIRDLTK